MTLGYNLPTSIAKRGFMQTARVYVTARNLATFTKYTGYDPEVDTQGLGMANYLLGHDFYTPPLDRTYIIGINIGF